MTSAPGAAHPGQLEAVDDAPGVRVPWPATIGGALVVTLARPRSWAVGLAGFLAGGGLVVMTWPILVLPTPTGLQNSLGGPVSSLVFGAPSGPLIAMLLGAFAGGVILFAGGLLVGAWAERQGIAIALEAAAEEGIAPAADLVGAPGAGRVALVRLLSLAPVAVALGLSWRPLYDVTYRQLTLPDDLATPLPIRVLRDVPLLVAAILATWLVSDAAGAVAVRRLVLDRRPVLIAWLLGWADLARRPQRIVPTALVGISLTLLALGPGLAAVTLGWARVREVMRAGGDPVVVYATVVVWVSVWLVTLVMAGVAAAFRNATWTLELPRRAAPAD